MKDRIPNYGHPGQALVELMVLIPVLLFLVAAVMPMISKTKIIPWLDERLFLKHFLQESDETHSLLDHAHKRDILPSYFGEDDLEETTIKVPGIRSGNIGFVTFPGELIRERVAFTLQKESHWNRVILGEDQVEGQKTHRSLTMVKTSALTEPQVLERVKQLTIFGSTTGIFRGFEKLGLKLLHINLDALPDPTRK